MYALTGKVFKGWQLVASIWMLVALRLIISRYKYYDKPGINRTFVHRIKLKYE
jgi:hypothetical protein